MLNQFVLGKPLWFFVWDPTIGGSLPAAAAFRTQVGGSARTSVRLQEDRGWPRKEVPSRVWARLAVFEMGIGHSDTNSLGMNHGCMRYIYMIHDLYMIYIWSIYDLWYNSANSVALCLNGWGPRFPVGHSESVEPWCHALGKTSEWRPSWLKK